MPDPHKYQAFISYSHTDQKWADWLHKSLETYRLPKRLRSEHAAGRVPSRLAPVFKDREELAAGNSLSAVIAQALDDSGALVVICSTASAKSRWVNQEVLHFRESGRAERIFCLIVDGNPGAASGSPDDCFAPALRLPLPGEITELEPLATDARASGDGRNDAKLKIIAGILGLGLDELKQRDLQRRNRRLTAIASASVVGMAVASALTVATLVARAEADEQRLAAERERETAERTTEFLVDLFSVTDPSESRGRSITASEILDTGRARIDSSLQGQPVVRGKLLTTMGRVYTGLGLYDTAIELLNDAPTASRDLSFQVALGTALYFQGDYTESIAAYRAAVARIEKAEPGSREWSETTSNAYSGLANALIDVDELREALELASYATQRDLDRWGAEHAQYAQSLSVLATVRLFLGETAAAEENLRMSAKAHELSLGEDHPQTLRTNGNLAAVLYMTEQIQPAMNIYERMLPLYNRVLGEDHAETASLLNNLGRIHLLRGAYATAAGHLATSVEIDRRLGRDRHNDLVFSLNSLAMSRRGLGDDEAGMALLDEALALASSTDHSMLGPIAVNRADLRCSASAPDDVLPTLAKARTDILRKHGADSWWLSVLESVEGACLASLGDTAHGRQQMERAWRALQQRWGDDLLYTKAALQRLERLD